MSDTASFDRRLMLARPDLADRALKGVVEAAGFAEPVRRQVGAPKAQLFRAPDASTGLDSELLFGEVFDVVDISGEWAWGRAGLDGYVGYMRSSCLAEAVSEPTHAVVTRSAQLYPAPELKRPPVSILPFASRVAVTAVRDGYAEIAGGSWLALPQLRHLDAPASDWVSIAESFLHTPYVWGGRSSWGLDCSALVQLSLQAAGRTCPRDSDQQEAALGATLPDDAPLQRGDIIWWKGHVGVMCDADRLLHANAHHMAVACEPLSEAVARIAQSDGGPITRRARLDVGAGSR